MSSLRFSTMGRLLSRLGTIFLMRALILKWPLRQNSAAAKQITACSTPNVALELVCILVNGSHMQVMKLVALPSVALHVTRHITTGRQVARIGHVSTTTAGLKNSDIMCGIGVISLVPFKQRYRVMG